MALYYDKMDSPGNNTRAGGCAEKWFAFYTGKIAAPVGLKAEDFGTITRDDGGKNTMYILHSASSPARLEGGAL
jgi:predicted lipoprotein with Yx(FWY)xxD motif